jgi:S-adenosylmethionine:tRNA ribosyltransferase-isomerase
MQTADFDYELPPELIAQSPAHPRDASRLLVYSGGKVSHHIFRELPELLLPTDVLVINETKVIPARLLTREGKEVFLSRKAAQSEGEVWECLVRGGKFFQPGMQFEIGEDLRGEVLEILPSGERLIRFDSSDFHAALDKYGFTPLPPYIHQTTQKIPEYQTVYAKKEGSVAAPTAGLHFTPEVFAKLAEKGIAVEKITLHVGLGTFAPVKAEEVEKHEMHSEVFELSSEVASRLNQYKQAGRRIIAVGSTSCRVLESCANENGELISRSGETDIFIYPGYRFRFIDAMLTNFHLPKSTLIMLIAAKIGREKILELYEIAKQEKYRFYSFGDAMLLL